MAEDPKDQSADEAEDQSEDLEGGSYEVLRNRLGEQARALAGKAEQLNESRKGTFGGTELEVIGNVRVRTENNCIPAEIISVGDMLLFGYNVHIGLKTETRVEDVFSLHRFEEAEEGFELPAVSQEEAGGFLANETFTRELTELYQYYKDPELLQLRSTSGGKLLAVFQVGSTAHDVKVFRWAVSADGRATYIDNRGERDHVFPTSHDFHWKTAGKERQIQGVYPHVSIEDEVFVETVGGDLTIKVENNTDEGEGILAEEVEDANQSLDDAEFHYAVVGGLILLKVLPYRETEYRYFVFNRRTKTVYRVDAIGQACVQLPEDHGIIFPSGYYLLTDQLKQFDGDISDLEYQEAVKSPNGEDVLYVFLHRQNGVYLLLPYNLIRKEVQNPIRCAGFTLFPDGKLIIFRELGDEPTRVHPMQIWKTPFTSSEFAASAPTDGSFLSKVGNADLVRGISDAFSIRRAAEEATPARYVYEDMVASCTRMLDAYYWLPNDDVDDMAATVRDIRKTAESIIDEFEKVQSIKARAATSLEEAQREQHVLVRDLKPDDWHAVEQFMDALASLRRMRGHLITLREMRYMDLEAVQALEDEAVAEFDKVSEAAVTFLLTDEAFTPLSGKLDDVLARIEEVQKTTEADPLDEEIEKLTEGLNVLSEVAAGLQVADPTARTTILEGVSEVFAHLNRVRATLGKKRKALMSEEGRAEFVAQFKLLGQSVDSALARADTPEACDEELSRLMLQLEEVESRFSEFDEFLGELAAKREEIYDALSQKKQTLVEERQRRALNLVTAAERILEGVGRRARTFKAADDLNTYFASDPMLLKLRELVERLRELGDSVKADEVEAKVKTARQDALRVLRDRTELFEEGENIIKLGRHRFSVNTQPFELTMLPRDGRMCFHLTGTDFYQEVDDEAFQGTAGFWDQTLVSESPEVYRAEYLAASILFDAEQGRAELTLDDLTKAALGEEGGLLALVRRYSADRYDEGYERGVHDADAALILDKLLALRATSGLLRFAPTPRALACLFWAAPGDGDRRARWARKAQSLSRLRSSFAFSPAIEALSTELSTGITAFIEGTRLDAAAGDLRLAGRYLVEELMAADGEPRFTTSAEAAELRDALLAELDRERTRAAFEEDLRSLSSDPAEAFALAFAWLEAFVSSRRDDPAVQERAHVRREAAALLVTDTRIDRSVSSAMASVDVPGLLGSHRRVGDGTLRLRLDEFLDRLGEYLHAVVPRYRAYREQRGELVEHQRELLRLEEFKPRVLTSFVRNRLINDVYLPLIGDNLSKQLGTMGESKRTDLMGMLLLISPPGYGKTTLMEYMASQLGLVFMKVNGPSLGHTVVSLDPTETKSATARQEVDKINLALEMGNNVMLYLDDIQHTNPELLQKFISLCDAQRRVEGVWKGKTRTYDMRGRKFCMVMAGNPYTESGDKFQIPDMLANRADTYNLGDILDGKDHLFALSYIENSLTSNETLSPLAAREQKDVYNFIRVARGEDVPASDFSHQYSAAEINDITQVLQHLSICQDLLLKVNQQYIYSAAQDDAYRTEPRFQLQGSYRNMNKLAEKVVPAMNEAELERLVTDHYIGEAQTLTTGAEQNLLKLGDLRGSLDEEKSARWNQIKDDFRRMKRLGGSESDPAVRVVSQLGDINDRLAGLREDIGAAATRASEVKEPTPAEQNLSDLVSKLDEAIGTLASPKLEVSVEQAQPKGMTDLLDQQIDLVEGILQLVHRMTKSHEAGESLRIQLLAAVNDLKGMDERLKGLTPPDLRRAPPAEGAPRPAPAPAARPAEAQQHKSLRDTGRYQVHKSQPEPAVQQRSGSSPPAEPVAPVKREKAERKVAERKKWEETVRKAEARRLATQAEPADSDRTTDPGMPPKKSPFPKADK